MNFGLVKKINIPEGSTEAIFHNSVQLWERQKYVYISFGDSIAAGHLITDSWVNDYGGVDEQYGENGNTETYIIPNTYTDLIRKELESRHGKENVYVKSFAHSGDWVKDLLEKLSHKNVEDAVRKANIVTICIGANDILQPALSQFGDYVANGKQALETLGNIVQQGLDNLASKSDTSYYALIDRLYSLNNKATYVFTRVYNPYKYLWLEESTESNNYKDGFFGPLMWSIPDFVGDSIANSVRSAILQTSAVETLFDRVNAIPEWAEKYITKLNVVLDEAIADFKADNPNAKFSIADTKRTFESFPDRPVSAPKHYNDLVNVEITRGYVIEDLDWGQFWSNVDWTSILTNIETVATDIVNNIVNNVILPDIDPHPETYGHEVMYRAFADALKWQNLTRYTITFNANGGTGSMPKQVVAGIGNSVYTILKNNSFVPMSTYRFDGWKDQNGNTYAEGQGIFITSDLTLYAQWSNLYVLTYTHSQGDVVQTGSNETGPMDYYQLWVAGTDNNIAGNPEGKLGAFSNPPVYYMLPYGTSVGVVVGTELGEGRSYITFNGDSVSGKSSYESYNFTITGNTVVNFEWNQWQSTDPSDYLIDFGQVSYWNCYIKTY